MDYPFKRKVTERKREAKRANISSINVKDIVGAKLGINRAGRNIDKISFEINRNRKNLKALGITDEELKALGLE
jgi:hypothetical protein